LEITSDNDVPPLEETVCKELESGPVTKVFHVVVNVVGLRMERFEEKGDTSKFNEVLDDAFDCDLSNHRYIVDNNQIIRC